MLKTIKEQISKETIIRFIKFGVVGTSGIFINSFVLWLCFDWIGIPLAIASPLAVATAIFNNFMLNNFWTWKKTGQKKHSFFHRLWRYYLSASLGASINYVTLLLLTEIFGLYYLIANLVGILLGMVSNFLLGELWVFKAVSEEEEEY